MPEPLVCGVDVGSRTAKAVIMRDGLVVASSIALAEVNTELSARGVVEDSLKLANAKWEDLSYVVATGYGRLRLSFANQHTTEITCHGRGAKHVFPCVRTVLDIGGQDCKAIRLGENGRVVNFVMNDKCAAGTGRCLERIAAAVRMPLEEIGRKSLTPRKENLRIDTFCAVFAQMDTTSLINEGKDPSDVLGAVFDGFASRMWALLNTVGIEPELCLTGGVGKNIGIVKRIEDKLGRPVKVPPDPQIVGALGAALIAQDKLGAKPANCY